VTEKGRHFLEKNSMTL